jgi:hypothetical protein
VTGTTVHTAPTPRPSAGELLAVAASSAKNAWAAGYVTARGPLILHWNGTAWKRSPLPSSARGRIEAVATTSPGNAWATDTRNRLGSQIWHWNGTRWHRVAIPVISGQTIFLGGVTALSAKNAWAVGTAFVRASVTLHTLVLHWNGARWRRVRSPNPPSIDGDALDGVGASSADNAWAVGSNTAGPSLAEHWDGTSWRAVPTHSCGSLASVAVLPSGRAWAVGAIGAQTPVILRWNGSIWQSVPRT